MKLFYAVNCGNDCEYYKDIHKKEKWAEAMLYGKPLAGYKVSNFGGIVKDEKFNSVERYLKYNSNNEAEICVYIQELKDDYPNGIELYKIIASTFSPPEDGKYCDENGNTKHIHHWDNNSYNFNPDNMTFLANHPHGQPHLYYVGPCKNIEDWNKLIDKICKRET